ncbi:unnamed protein product [Plutella xylostella]|uniref:(diamondback moth) hypothetical protein n=1 Tax=Plutella xylostella TaxID=51655 RepID=A0A8S4ESR8_PLUXY|nr:unnamed protein product [Plutella xylostella]
MSLVSCLAGSTTAVQRELQSRRRLFVRTTSACRHIHDKTYRRRDGRKCYNQREVTRKRDRETGLHNVAYRTHSVHNLTIDSLPVTVLSVELICDKNVTPWCQCPEPVKPKKTR